MSLSAAILAGAVDVAVNKDYEHAANFLAAPATMDTATLNDDQVSYKGTARKVDRSSVASQAYKLKDYGEVGAFDKGTSTSIRLSEFDVLTRFRKVSTKYTDASWREFNNIAGADVVARTLADMIMTNEDLLLQGTGASGTKTESYFASGGTLAADVTFTADTSWANPSVQPVKAFDTAFNQIKTKSGVIPNSLLLTKAHFDKLKLNPLFTGLKRLDESVGFSINAVTEIFIDALAGASPDLARELKSDFRVMVPTATAEINGTDAYTWTLQSMLFARGSGAMKSIGMLRRYSPPQAPSNNLTASGLQIKIVPDEKEDSIEVIGSTNRGFVVVDANCHYGWTGNA